LCHEVGNLLAATRLSAHLLGRGPSSSETVSVCGDIEELTAQAGALLAHVRPLLSEPELESPRVAPAAVLESVARSLGERAWEAVRVEVLRPGSLPDVEFDPDAIHHLLVTLVRAACESARPNGHVRVSAAPVRGGVVFSVEDDGRIPLEEDTGPGMPQRGRALTLAVARAILAASGGHLEVAHSARRTRIEVRVPSVGPLRRPDLGPRASTLPVSR
jgi:signal transduction histidine kinase